MNKLKVILSLIVFGILISCSKKHVLKKECIELNDKGADILMKYTGNVHSLDTAISFLNQAVKCDTLYTIAYLNLANAYEKAARYNEEITVFNKLLLFGDNPSILMEKAMAFKRLNNLDSAKATYKSAGKILRKIPQIVDINYMRSIISFKALTEGKEAAIKEINN